MSAIWTKVSKERYEDMLNILPPVAHMAGGFLVGEAWSHKFDHSTRQSIPTFVGFKTINGEFFACAEPLTVAEFLVITNAEVLENLE